MIATEIDALGSRLEAAITAEGGKLELLEFYPKHLGLIIAAKINGRLSAVRVYSASIVGYQDLARYLMLECQAGVEEPFPQDADIIGLHEGAFAHAERSQNIRPEREDDGPEPVAG